MEKTVTTQKSNKIHMDFFRIFVYLRTLFMKSAGVILNIYPLKNDPMGHFLTLKVDPNQNLMLNFDQKWSLKSDQC